MRIHSDSFGHRQPIPAEFAMGRRDGFAPNRNPHLAWDEVPEGTRSFALLCIDPDVREIATGSCSDGISAKGKRNPPGPVGARQGLNDYTGWFAGDADMGGDYFGYDGPYPPFNDLRTHRYFFRLFALDVAKLDLPQRFTAGDALRAMHGHVLDEALVYGTYSLHA